MNIHALNTSIGIDKGKSSLLIKETDVHDKKMINIYKIDHEKQTVKYFLNNLGV